MEIRSNPIDLDCMGAARRLAQWPGMLNMYQEERNMHRIQSGKSETVWIFLFWIMHVEKNHSGRDLM